MKIITFFNEKGGVGKSIMNVMYASWLHYKHGMKVGFVDFNDRIERNRKTEMTAKKKLEKFDDIKEADLWPIASVDHKFVRSKSRAGMFGHAMWFDHLIKSDYKDRDIVVVDFPGSLEDGSFTQLINYRLISQIVLVTDADLESMLAALNVNKIVRATLPEINICGFVNQARLKQKNYEKKYYNEVKTPLMNLGMRLLPDTVSYSERIVNIDKPDIMRSSLMFPDWDDPAFEGGRDLGTENLFIDVTRELAKAPEIKGTPKTDLSFVASLTKTDDGRQFKNSSFPEYEI